jgi:hypothetical protein
MNKVRETMKIKNCIVSVIRPRIQLVRVNTSHINQQYSTAI